MSVLQGDVLAHHSIPCVFSLSPKQQPWCIHCLFISVLIPDILQTFLSMKMATISLGLMLHLIS